MESVRMNWLAQIVGNLDCCQWWSAQADGIFKTIKMIWKKLPAAIRLHIWLTNPSIMKNISWWKFQETASAHTMKRLTKFLRSFEGQDIVKPRDLAIVSAFLSRFLSLFGLGLVSGAGLKGGPGGWYEARKFCHLSNMSLRQLADTKALRTLNCQIWLSVVISSMGVKKLQLGLITRKRNGKKKALKASK